MSEALPRSGGLISFRVAIITTVVGLLVVTCGFLLGFGIHATQQSVGTLKNEYLEQVADTTVREVSRLPDTAEQVLRVQRFRFETGLYSTSDPVALARALAGALQTDRTSSGSATATTPRGASWAAGASTARPSS